MAVIKHVLKNLFEASFRWNLGGSLLFEVMRIFNNLFMMHALSGDGFGIVGSAYATVYLAARVATFGTPYVIAPLFEKIEKSLFCFKEIVLKMLLLGCLINSMIAAIIVSSRYTSNYTDSVYPSAFILGILVVIETFRIFLRQFLHCAFLSKVTIFAEQIPFIIYLILLVLAGYYDANFITPSTIFICYLIEAIIVLTLLIIILAHWYIRLPDDTDKSKSLDYYLPGPTSARIHICELWFSVGTLKTVRELSTNNLLTPLFVSRFGLAPAGVFYAASSIAMSLYRIMRATIGNAGLALLAHAKSSPKSTKQAAFKEIIAKLLFCMIPFIVISFMLNSKLLIQWYPSIITFGDGFDMFVIYLAIAVIEFLSIPYEQFYIVEEASCFVLLVRMGECMLFYTAFILMEQARLTTLLSCLFFLKLMFIVILALNAYRRWGITPLAVKQR